MSGNRKLGRPTAHRNAMLRGMVTFLLEKGQIETTYTRAKEIAALADHMITLAKQGIKNDRLTAYRRAMAYITKEAVVAKLFNEIAPSYEKTTSGYTHVYKLGPRRGDAAEMAIVKLAVEVKEEPKAAPVKKTAKKTAKKAEDVVTEAPAEETAPATEE